MRRTIPIVYCHKHLYGELDQLEPLLVPFDVRLESLNEKTPLEISPIGLPNNPLVERLRKPISEKI